MEKIILILSISLFILFLCIAYKKPIAGSKFVTFLLLAGLVLRIIYFLDTPYNVRSYDFDGHLDYIKYIVANNSLPAPNTGWEYWQPPLYYLVASLVYKLASAPETKIILLQLLSLVFNAGFLYFGIKMLRLFLPKNIGDKYFYLASSLLIFWPAGIMYSITITNDSLLYFLTAGGMYFSSKWFLDGKFKNIFLATLFLFASLLTKSSGIILLGIICLVVLSRFILTIKPNPKKAIYFLKTFLFIILISFTCFAIIFFSRLATNGPDRKHGFFTNMPFVNSGLLVGNGVKNFVVFDADDFFKNTFTDSWNDKGGRQYFSNYFLKTSLFGEFHFPQSILNNEAKLLNYLVILIFIIICAWIIMDFVKLKQYFEEKNIYSPQILLTPIIILFLATLIFYRHLYPYSCNGDFRYIYPVVIPLSASVAFAIYRFNVAYIGEIISYSFVITSIIFFVSLGLL